MEIKDMTDAQMVEVIAQKIMGFLPAENGMWKAYSFGDVYRAIQFYPLTNANDLQLVKDKLREMGWIITIVYADRVYVNLTKTFGWIEHETEADTESRAICEAAIKAVEGK